MASKEKFVAVPPGLQPSSDFNAPPRRGRSNRSRMAAGGPRGYRALSGTQKRILIFTWLGLFFMATYCATLGVALFQPGYTFLDRIASCFLLLGLSYIIIHGLGYANSMIKAVWGYKEIKSRLFVTSNAPSVVCIVASFNEPPEVLEETISTLMSLDYPNKEIVLLDDSTKEENRRAARDIADYYGVRCIQRTTRRGYKAGAINDFLEHTDAEYLAIFDADALPVVQFLREVVPLIAENPKLSFVQTPQFYANTNVSYVALAAARQQNVFYEYICEGKSYSQAAFCCGTNVVFRRKALVEVGGFNEESVTEDFATSFDLHTAGWDSLYLNRVFVYSLAPENLAAYFTQQSRWSFGSLSSGRLFLRQFFKNPRALRGGQWWEYFLSASYYWIGWVNFIFICLPLTYIFFGIKPLRQDVFTYMAVFVPYFLFTLNMFYTGMEARGFNLGQMILGQQIGFISFPLHMTSGVSALFGRKRPFGVTPKGVGGRLPWKSLWPQLTMLALSVVGVGWGTYKYVAGLDRNSTAIVINSFWALYQVWMLGSIFRLNQPVRVGESQKAFFVNNARETNRLPHLSPLEGARSPVRLKHVGAFGLTLITLCVGTLAWSILSWRQAPQYPVNVYLVDRTVGPNAHEHRFLFWTLNYLKVTKQPRFGPDGGGDHTTYDPQRDYFGFVPNLTATPKADRTGQGDLVSIGSDRPLPSRLTPPGALYLIDTYGEFVQFDAKLQRYVRYRSPRRGLNPEEIDSIDNFARRGGLLIGEWNTLSYPTRPGSYIPVPQMDALIARTRVQLRRLQTFDLRRAQRAREVAERSTDYRAIGRARGALEDVRGRITDTEYKLRGMQGSLFYNALQARQGEAAKRLEGLMHVSYDGWYGRYVDNFADEREYDFRLWKNVRDYLTRKNGGKTVNPKGPGFVFYPDGPSEFINPNTGQLEHSPFSEPIAILGDELGRTLTNDVAVIRRSKNSELADDPLLRGVGAEVPGRCWFDVVKPAAGARVLAWYHLKVTPAAVARLRAAGFPKTYLPNNDGRVVFPALVAWRDGGTSQGQLRSLYFAGNVADYPTVSPTTQQFPALSNLDRYISGHYGSFTSQFFWNYYEPILRNTFADTPRIRYTTPSSVPNSSTSAQQ